MRAARHRIADASFHHPLHEAELMGAQDDQVRVMAARGIDDSGASSPERGSS